MYGNFIWIVDADSLTIQTLFIYTVVLLAAIAVMDSFKGQEDRKGKENMESTPEEKPKPQKNKPICPHLRVPMSLEEVMEDMRLMTGSRPKRVSDKRPKKVKQTLEVRHLFLFSIRMILQYYLTKIYVKNEYVIL